MATTRTVREWMADRGMTLEQLESASRVDHNVLEAICEGRYTPSPQQRERVAAALGVEPARVAWGHVTPVSHLYGHGPQFGRTP